MFNEYSDKVIDHFMSPRNVGSINNPDGEGQAGDPACGDSLTIYIKVENQIIKEIKFLVFGCVAAVATSSMTTVLVKGKSVDEALKLTEQDITDALDGLPDYKLHCSVLGAEALRNAIHDYKNRQENKETEHE